MNWFQLILCSAVLAGPMSAGEVSKVWVADNGDGTYKNPILYADYSDPDVIRVGDDFYMVSSSFDQVPGLPVLHSRDLVNWSLIGHALDRQVPVEHFRKVQHGNGAWAPSIRFRNGEFYVFYPDPDFGIYLTKARNPAGPWSSPLLVQEVKGWIDPCPLWDDDGQAYLVHGVAASRSSLKSVLVVHRMSPDGTRLLDSGAIVFDGHGKDPTLEGPKFYKRNGYYYILAPAGGVPGGWQLALRSKNPWGPYERKVVLAQGSTQINGPHQGGLVSTQTGEDWFIHFQDKGPNGRIVHLQPVKWVDGWPMMGASGEPVLKFRKPDVGKGKIWPVATPAESDEFNSPDVGLQWQWAANPQLNWAFPSPALGALRMICQAPVAGAKNLWDVPNLLMQKFPAPEFTATAKVTLSALTNGDKTGLVIMGQDYAYVALQKTADGFVISQVAVKDANRGTAETVVASAPVKDSTAYLRVKVTAGATCTFSYSTDGTAFRPIGINFRAREGQWIGAKVGIFAQEATEAYEAGWADFDWFRVDR